MRFQVQIFFSLLWHFYGQNTSLHPRLGWSEAVSYKILGLKFLTQELIAIARHGIMSVCHLQSKIKDLGFIFISLGLHEIGDSKRPRQSNSVILRPAELLFFICKNKIGDRTPTRALAAFLKLIISLNVRKIPKKILKTYFLVVP